MALRIEVGHEDVTMSRFALSPLWELTHALRLLADMPHQPDVLRPWLVRARDRYRALGRETPIGWTPRYEDIEWEGLDFSKEQFDELQAFDRKAWRHEVIGHEELFIDLHDHLPPEIIYERELLICRL